MEVQAVRPGVDGTLDAVRRVHWDCLEDLQALVGRYAAEWGMPALKLVHTASRGHHLSLPIAAAERLPEAVVQAVRHKASISASTDELLSLNDRAKVRRGGFEGAGRAGQLG